MKLHRFKETLDFLCENNLADRAPFDTLSGTQKGRQLLDYLGITYDLESYSWYSEYYHTTKPSNDRLITDKMRIGWKDIRFDYVYTIIIPLYDNNGNRTPEAKLSSLRDEFSRRFEGLTKVEASGEFHSKFGVQKDSSEIWWGFGKKADHSAKSLFLKEFARRVGSQDSLKQDAVVVLSREVCGEIVDTLDMKFHLDYLQHSSLFCLESMILLASICATEYQGRNFWEVYRFGKLLGFE